MAAADACDVFLPWPGFEGRADDRVRLVRPAHAAYQIAARHHPNWSGCTPGARSLHARNAHEVLGATLDAPSKFLLCWTPDGADGLSVPTTRATGGTGQAIRIAVAYGVPVFNLERPDHRDRVERMLTRAQNLRETSGGNPVGILARTDLLPAPYPPDTGHPLDKRPWICAAPDPTASMAPPRAPW